MSKLFTKDTQAIFWNNNKSAIQRMLDYDYVIKREKPSVAAIVAPTSGSKFEKFFYDDSTELLVGDWVASSGDLKAYSMKIEMGGKTFRPIYFFQQVGDKYLYRPLNDFNAYSFFVTQMQHKEELKTLSYMDKVKVLLSPNTLPM